MYDGTSIKIKQQKTGALIKVKCSAELRWWLDNTPRIVDYIIFNETTGKPYNKFTFRHEIGDAIKGAGIEGKQYRDLRRTAVVRLAEAGCSIAEIAAITGHAIESCQKILEVYLPRNAIMAANGIDRLESYRAEKVGIKVGTPK